MPTPVVRVEHMHLVNGTGVTKAFCDLVILDTFVVKGLRIVNGKHGLFLSMPTQKSKDGKWYETFYPTSKEMRKGLQSLVLEAYELEMEQVKVVPEQEQVASKQLKIPNNMNNLH